MNVAQKTSLSLLQVAQKHAKKGKRPGEMNAYKRTHISFVDVEFLGSY